MQHRVLGFKLIWTSTRLTVGNWRHLSHDRGAIIRVLETLDRLGGAPGVFLQPSIKLLDAFFKPGFTASRIPLLQIARSDEVSPPDPHDWNAIFLNNSAETARLIARLKSRAGNIEQLCLEACGN